MQRQQWQRTTMNFIFVLQFILGFVYAFRYPYIKTISSFCYLLLVASLWIFLVSQGKSRWSVGILKFTLSKIIILLLLLFICIWFLKVSGYYQKRVFLCLRVGKESSFFNLGESKLLSDFIKGIFFRVNLSGSSFL